MSGELTLFVLRLAFLAVLWIFVFSIIYALRSDLFGTRASEYQRTLEQSRAHTFGAADEGEVPVVAAVPVGAAVGGAGAAAPPMPSPRPRGDQFAGADAPTQAVPAQNPAAGRPRGFEGAPAGGTAAPRQPALPSRIVITSGPRRGFEMQLHGRPVTIGRHPDSDLVIADDYSSTHHARLVPSRTAWTIHDLGSTNGTFIDGRRIDSPIQLAPGQPVRIGTTTFELRR